MKTEPIIEFLEKAPEATQFIHWSSLPGRLHRNRCALQFFSNLQLAENFCHFMLQWSLVYRIIPHCKICKQVHVVIR